MGLLSGRVGLILRADGALGPVYASTGRVKAIASVTLDDGFVLKSIRVVEREDDTILAMPRFRQVAREEGAEPRWVETYHPISAEVRKTLTDTVLLAYEKEKIQAQT